MSDYKFGGFCASAENKKKKKHKQGDIARIRSILAQSYFNTEKRFEVRIGNYSRIYKSLNERWKWEWTAGKRRIFKTYADFEYLRNLKTSIADKALLTEFQCFFWHGVLERLDYKRYVSVSCDNRTLWVVKEDPTIVLLDGADIAMNYWMGRIDTDFILSVPRKIEASIEQAFQEYGTYPDYTFFNAERLQGMDESKDGNPVMHIPYSQITAKVSVTPSLLAFSLN